MTSYWAQHALLPDGLASAVLIEIADGRFTAVTPNSPQGTARRLPGVVMPGFANCHSHAFHRALRGRTHGEGGTFWTWRDRMYHVAAQLDPDNYLALARAAYAEMALAGITAVGSSTMSTTSPTAGRMTTRTRWGRAPGGGQGGRYQADAARHLLSERRADR